MKKFLLIVAAALSAVLIGSCKKEEIKEISKVLIKVEMPSDFPSSATYNGEVVLTDKTTGEVRTANAVASVATFEKVPFGSYKAYAASTMSNNEFKSAAPELCGALTSDIALNSNSADIILTQEADAAEPFNLRLSWNVASTLLISRIYNFGTLNLAEKAYSKDKFIEIFNNSAEVQYADGLCIAEVYPSAVGKSAYEDVTTGTSIYAITVSAFPGSGKEYPIEPGKSIVLAQNAMNHIDAETITNTSDLSGADFEAYQEGNTTNFPSDNADVPNMIAKFAYNQYTKFMVTNGGIYALLKISDDEIKDAPLAMVPGSDAYGAQWAVNCKALPASAVLDAVDLIREGYESRGGSHFPGSIDATNAVINQKCITLRKIRYITEDGRIVLQDTNNSANDFVKVESANGDALKIRDYSNPAIQPAQ